MKARYTPTQPHRSEADHAEPNQGLIAKPSCRDKRDNRACLKLTDKIFFLCTLSTVWFFKEARGLGFRQKSTHPGGTPRLSYSQLLGTIQTVNLLRHTLENSSSPRVVTVTWLLKIKNEQDLNIKPGQIHKLKIIKRAMDTDWSDHRHNTTIQNTHI
jgi:hypothetical protein